MRLLTPWTTDLLDLVLARACLECGRSGRVWCIPCVASVPRDLNPASVPGNDVPLVCAARYDGHVREAIIDYKEHGNRALAPMLGQLLAEAAIAHLRGSGAPGAVIVPVPGHRRPERGFDALGGVVRAARRDVARAGLPTLVVPAVRMRRDAGPIKTLGRAQREAAVSGAMRPASARTLDRARVPLPLVVVDDVVTTGTTVSETVAALRSAGVEPIGIAAVARA